MGHEGPYKLRKFMGVTTWLGSSALTNIRKHPWELLSSKWTWSWNPGQEQSLSRSKKNSVNQQSSCSTTQVLLSKISVASSYGLGAVLLQEINSTWKPVVYASHALTKTKTGTEIQPPIRFWDQTTWEVKYDIVKVTWAKYSSGYYI